MPLFLKVSSWAILPLLSAAWAQNSPVISLVANAEGENAVIAPNTWVEIKGTRLASSGDSRTWQNSDFHNSQLPVSLDGVSVTFNGKPAYVYYISPTQVNVLTPPDAMPAGVSVQLTNNGQASAAFAVKAQSSSPSFFNINGSPYVVAQHSADYSLVAPSSLFPGASSPARPGETVLLYANGFGPTTPAAVSGAITQSGNLTPLPSVAIGGIPAEVQFAGLVSPGLFQINVVIPGNASTGDNTLSATLNGVPVAPVALIAVQGSTPAPSAVTFYVAPNGSDLWSGRLAAPNAAASDGPFATLDHARLMVQNIAKAGLNQVNVQVRAGTYYLPSTVMFTAADSGTASMQIVYQNYSGESPVFSGGTRVLNWTHTAGNTWKASLPASTQYFENLFYNGARRLRPRLGVSTANPLGTFYRIANTVYLDAPGPPAAAPSQTCSVYIPGSGWECFDRLQYSAADPIASTWKNLVPAAGNPCGQPAGNQAIAGDIELLVFEQFSTSKLRVSCVDATKRIVYLTGPTGISQNNASEQGFISGNRYLLENVEDALTQPGQWFLDRSATPWTLTYLANPGEDPNAGVVVIPQLAQLLVASNLQYVTFQGLTFEHDNYTLPFTGHISSELEPEIPAAVSFQNSQHITFDSGTVTQTSGTGLEMIPCLNANSPSYCVAADPKAVVTNNIVQNSAFYDIGAVGIRIGNPYQPADNDSNVPQFTTVRNNVVEGYGRTIPAAFGIGQGMGHDNLYTHNDVYDGYHCAISTSQSIADNTVPAGIGNANNVISFNHVYNLLQGIMNDGGSIRIDGGNQVFTAAGNKILNNKIHDVTDASVMDSNGYGGHGVYLDDSTGLVDVENNLIYRVSGFGVYTPHGPAGLNQANTVRNNIVAFARLAMVSVGDPYKNGVPTTIPQSFVYSNNLFYFDRASSSSPKFLPDGGCLYSEGFPFTQYQLWKSNLYWRTDGAFASDSKAFGVQAAAGTGAQAPCGNFNSYSFYGFATWQQSQGEDLQSVVQNPGFNNPSYPADDYSLPHGSPGIGFVVFDAGQAGRSNPVLKPPPVASTFPVKLFNPATDY
uniref:IPT/TIG domain-containing protein n=1 Tax=Solibacter usitatus (strain Ellin6076) TaxID=234267 RepID=Q01N79_SOLUE